MIPRTTLLCVVVLLTACAASLPRETPLPAVSAGQEIYVVDSSHTFPNFEVSHLGFSTHRGRFNKTTGWVVLDRAAHTGSMELRIETDSLDTGDPRLEERLRAEDFFDSANYPYLFFKSNKLRFAGEALASIDGELTLRGVTRPITLSVTSFHCGKRPIVRQDACGANAETTIKRSAFGMSAYLGAVGDDVKLLIQVEAVKR